MIVCMAAASIWAVLQLLVLSWPMRVIRWPGVLLCIGVGIYGCGVVTLLLEVGVARVLAGSQGESISGVMDTVTWTTAPVAEELIKILPLVVAGWLLRRRMQWGLTDFVVCGGAIGAGFGLLESVLAYGGAGPNRMIYSDIEGGWRILTSLEPPFVPGPGLIFSHWFPPPTGSVGVPTPVLDPDHHLVWTMLGGLGAGLFFCGRRWWTKTAGVLPLAAAIGAHLLNNYVAVHTNTETATEWSERIAGWGVRIILVVLAMAITADWWRARQGRRVIPELQLAREQPGQIGTVAAYALLRPPFSTIVAVRFARLRRAVAYMAGQPGTDPERLQELHPKVADMARRMDASHSAEAWRQLDWRAAWRQARAERRRWPASEKWLLAATVVLVAPAGLAAAGTFLSLREVQEFFSDGTGLRLLIGCATAGLILVIVRLVQAIRGLRPALAQPWGEPGALASWRIWASGGAVLAGVMLLWRAGALADGNPLVDQNTIHNFLLDKLFEAGLPLLLTIALFALPMFFPYAAPLFGAGLGEVLLGAVAPRLLAPVVGRLATRWAAREAARAWGRGVVGSGRGLFTRIRDRIRSWRTDPVDLATGRMFLEETDVDLPGALPLLLTRRVDSGYRGGLWFGSSWASSLDQRIESDAHGLIFFTEDGLVLAYPHPTAPRVEVYPDAGPRLALATVPDGGWQIRDPETELMRTFAPDGRLLRITDRLERWVTFAYDSDGAPVEVVHHGGYCVRVTCTEGRVTALALATDTGEQQLVAYGYDDVGNLITVTKPSGGTLTFAYDAAHRPTSWTDSNDRSYHYRYDDHDRVVAESSRDSSLAYTLTYGGSHPEFPGFDVTTVTAADGAAASFVIDDRHRVIAEIDPSGATLRTHYDDADRPIAVTDALGRTTGYRRDATGSLVAVVRPDGSQTTADYDTAGNLVQVTDAIGAIWRQEFDTTGNCTAATDPTGAAIRYSYDDSGYLTTITDPLGAVTHLQCNPVGLPVEITDPLGAVTRLERDAFGRVIRETDPLGATTAYSWTPEGWLLSHTAPDGATETWTYDGEGNCTSHTTPAGAITRFEYGDFDRPTARIEPDGTRHTFTHDTQLRLTGVTNPQNLTWTYTYNAAGHVIAETDFDGRTTTYDRDPAGRVTACTTALGEHIDYTYDALDRLAEVRSPDGTTSYTYDPVGNLAEATNPDSRLTRKHDQAGRLLSETVNGRTLHLNYDAAGQLTHRRTPTGTETTYTYDAAGSRTNLTTVGRTITTAYDPVGRPTTTTFGHTGPVSTRSWDATGRLLGQRITGPANTAPLQHEYSWRPDGNLTARNSEHYTLDPAGRVTAVHAPHRQESYAYDSAGNQTDATWPDTLPHSDASGPRTYAGTRLLAAGTWRYEYDAAGRTTCRQQKRVSQKPATWHYKWNTDNRLTQVTTPDGTRWRYTYDPLGRRIAKHRLESDGEAAAEETLFSWHGSTLIEQTATSTEWPGIQTLSWDHDETGLAPLAQTDRYAPTVDAPQSEIDTAFYAIVTDQIGTPTELLAESGDVVWQAKATLWGTTTWSADAVAYTPLRYPGQYHDLETGHHYNLHRHYNPETARYLTPDPLGLTPAPNPNAYVHNPLTWIDPLGLAPNSGIPPKTANGLKPPPSKELVPYDRVLAHRQEIGLHLPRLTTPGGRTLSAHAAERLAGTGPGRPPTTLKVVDHILDKGTKVKYDPVRQTIQVRAPALPGKPFVVVSAQDPAHIVTMMIPKLVILP